MPGFDPVEFNVVIAPEVTDDAKEITRNDGSTVKLHFADHTKHTQDVATVRGLLVSISPLAFDFADWPADQMALRPKPGDHVIYAKFAGILLKGDDGREYRLCKDKDVSAVIRDPSAKIEIAALSARPRVAA